MPIELDYGVNKAERRRWTENTLWVKGAAGTAWRETEEDRKESEILFGVVLPVKEIGLISNKW